ncbi:hypothetical protein H5410_040161 [Solanum commersonii]|uniref:Uncharacterized protein n=1 Tax=Solanum commersonii TaxID=4109 RepID=A0A9J5XQ62_SOLCO|nr:hypothetical protein H5410_040161 [Solanum commersonii]
MDRKKIKTLHFSTNQIIPLQIKDHPEGSKGSPSHFKIDKTGVHFPKNVEKATVPAKGTASLVQTVAGKDSSNPLMANTLPKSVKILPASFNTPGTSDKEKKNKDSLQKFLGEKTKEVIREYSNPEPETTDTEESESNEYDPSLEQFAQDPNEEDDSGMSFDSVALHNLDT